MLMSLHVFHYFIFFLVQRIGVCSVGGWSLMKKISTSNKPILLAEIAVPLK